MRDENGTTAADLPVTRAADIESDKAGRSEFTVAGFGTGTVAEIESHLAQITDERDAARRALAHLEHLQYTSGPDATDGAELVATIARIAERGAQASAAGDLVGEVAQLTADLRAVKTAVTALQREVADIDTDTEIDGDAVWDEIEYRVREVAEESASEAAGEIDGDGTWAEISDRVDEAAADAVRDVIRNELVVNVDLI